MFEAFLQSKVLEQTQNDLYRDRYQSDQIADGIVFCSNDYLGLAKHAFLKTVFKNAIDRYGVGSGASQMISGHHSAHAKLEEKLAAFLGVPKTLVFSTGFMANLGVLTAIAQRDDSIFEDKRNHASLIDGGRYSEAEFKRFQHADLSDLERRLQQSQSTQKFIVSDGVFSMDGDTADIAGLQTLAERYQATLMIDDAHGIGMLGKQGRGLYEHAGLTLRDGDILTGTFGKAFGSFGAFVAGSEALIDYLIQFSRTYIYTTAMPPALAETISAAIDIVETETWRRDRLVELIHYFKQAAQQRGLNFSPSNTAIQPLIIGHTQKTVVIAEALRKKGFFVTAIRPPTVAKNTARLRITLSVEHTEKQIDALLNTLKDAITSVKCQQKQ